MLEDRADAEEEGSALSQLIGETDVMGRLRREVTAVAPLDSTVLLTGETGTGKGHLARAVHEHSRRAGRPFVHVDCAALSPTIIESELFGHEKGAFTSAGGRHIGRFEHAGRGTIFLDEIGDLEPRLQSKLLRVLDDRAYERLGGTETLRMRARVIAATCHDLKRAVQTGHFRADLYYRLNVFHLAMPPLRERASDVPLLVRDGFRRLAARLDRQAPLPTEAFVARLERHSWPGNVRELMNVLERVFVQHSGRAVTDRALEPVLEDWEPQSPPWEAPRERDAQALPGLAAAVGEFERSEIQAALVWSGGNVAGAARRLRMARSTLRHRMQKYEVERPAAGTREEA